MHLLFDIGGTKMRFAISDNYKTLSSVNIFSSSNNFEECIKLIESKKDEITKGNKIDSISGGIAGVVKANKLLKSPHLSDWINKPIAQEFTRIFKSRFIYIKNDASLAGLGESVLGAGKDYDIVAYLTISTGVGGVRIVDKKIDESSFGFEPGHQIINFDENKFCTLEELVSGSALEKKHNVKPSLINNEDVWKESEEILALGLNNITVMWSPDVIILGGGITNSGNLNLENISNNLKHILDIFPQIPDIKQSMLGEEVGLYGALFHLKYQHA